VQGSPDGSDLDEPAIRAAIDDRATWANTIRLLGPDGPKKVKRQWYAPWYAGRDDRLSRR
jgi:hypothetical protein